MKVLIFVAFVATSIFAETPVGRQRYFVAQPAGQSGPYAPRGWKPDGPSLNLPERQNQPSVNVRYPQNIAPTEQQRQQPSQFAPFEVEIDFAPAISANSQRIDVQPQFQSQYREPNRVYGAPSVQIASPRETYGPPVQQHNINLDNQYGVPPQGRFNVPNNQQFGAVPQQELTPPSLSNNPIVFNPTPTQQSSKLSNPTNPYEAPKQSQYIPPSFDNQYNVPVNQFDSPNKQSPYQPSATNAQEFNSPNKQPFGINNENDNEYRVPAKQQFGVGPNIQDQFNEPGQDEFGVQNPQTSNREPKFENDQRNTNPRNPNGVPNQYPLNQNNVPANPNNRFGPRNPSYSFGSRNPQNNFGSPSHRNPVGSQNPQNQFGNDNGQYPRVPDTRYGAPPNQYQTPRFGIPNPESNNFNSPRPQYKDEELTTTEESTSTDEIESTTVLAQSESEEENTSDEFSEEIEDAAKPRQSTKLAKPQRGEYYVSLPDGRLQRVRYISQQDIEAMRYFAKIRAENVEPLRGPIYAYAPLQEIKIGSESSSPESLSVSASELKPQSTDVDGGKVDAIKPLAQVQYQLDNPAGFLLPLTTSYSTLLANYANSPNEERLIVAIP